jgi:hypothetical protein
MKTAENLEFTIADIEITSLAGVVHKIFAEFSQGQKDGRNISAAWRQRLDIRIDEEFYDALALVRRTTMALVAQISTTHRIKDSNRARHLDVVTGFADSTSFGVLNQQVASRHQFLNEDRMHALATLDELLNNEDPRVIIPSKNLQEFISTLQKIRTDIDTLTNIPPLFHSMMLSQIDRIIWSLSLSSAFGANLVFETATKSMIELRYLPFIPEAASTEIVDVSSRFQVFCKQLFDFLDAAEIVRKRATNASYLMGGSSIIIAGLLSAPAL